MGFPGGSDGKASACNAGDLGLIPGWGRSPGEGMATHSSTLAWRIPWTEEPSRLQSMRSQRVGHDWATSLSLSRRPTRSSRTYNTKDVLSITGNWNTKIESQEISRVTGKSGLGVQNETGQKLTEFCQENMLVIAIILSQQHKRWLYTWTSPDGQYQTLIDYALCSQRWRSSLQSAKQDWELTVTQIINSLLTNSDLNWRR